MKKGSAREAQVPVAENRPERRLPVSDLSYPIPGVCGLMWCAMTGPLSGARRAGFVFGASSTRCNTN